MELNKQNILKRCEALFLRYGIKSVTMDDITRELGMSKKTLYQHFDTKSKIIEQIIAEHTSNQQILITHIAQTTSDALDEILRIAHYVLLELARLTPTILYDLQKYHRELWLSFEKNNNEHIYTVIRRNIERGIKEGIYRANMNADIIAKLYVNSANSMLNEDLFPLEKYSKVDLYKQFITYHLQGILSPQGLERLAAMPQHLV